MDVALDIVTGTTPPSYTMEIVRRLPATIRARLLPSKGYGLGRLATAYRLVDHPLRILRQRRRGAVLHIDSQLLAYVLAFPQAPPRVLTCYDVVPFLPEYDDPSYVSRENRFDRLFFRRLARGMHLADRIITVSDFTRRELVAMGIDERRIDVIPLGVDPATFRPRPPQECRAIRSRYGIPRDDPMVLYVGTEHPRKNLPRLYRAFAELVAPVVLVKVGAFREPQHRGLQQLALSLKIANRVCSVEHVAADDLPLLYGTADVLVLASLTEGFGLPPLEAMACGTPVAVSNAGSLPALVGTAGVRFDPLDERAIADTLRDILANPRTREELRAKGPARAVLFPWEATIAGIVRTYRAALAAE